MDIISRFTTAGAANRMLTDHCNDYGQAQQLSSSTLAMTLTLTSLSYVPYIQMTILKWCNANKCALTLKKTSLTNFSHTAKLVMTIHTESWRLSMDGNKNQVGLTSSPANLTQ